MAFTDVNIYNMACSAITTRSTIGAVNEASVEAQECTLWYATVRDQVLSSAMWDCVTRASRLALLATRDQSVDWVQGDPLPGWTYGYALPSDVLRPRYLTSFASFTLGIVGVNTQALMTNQELALLIYSGAQTDPSLWDQDLRMAVAQALAAKIARKLTGSRTKALDAYNLAQDLIGTARANARNKVQTSLDFAPSAMIARGSANLQPQSPYIYPSAEFIMSGFGNVA